jgi:F-type H+-transporting ATPase subunit gamma
MPNRRELEERFRSVKKIKQIVYAMELIARNRLRRVRDKALSGRPYAEKIADILTSIGAKSTDLTHPLLISYKQIKTVCLVTFSSDKGLCGGFNNIILEAVDREVAQAQGKEIKIIAVGKRALAHYKRKEYDVIASYDGLENNRELEIAQDIASKISQMYTVNEAQKIVLIYNKYRDNLVGKAVLKSILPVTFEANKEKSKEKQLISEHLFEPSRQELLNQLLPQYVTNQLFQAALESRAQEEMARMVSMKQASDSADEMISSLELEYNKLRQSQITAEIMEVINAS